MRRLFLIAIFLVLVFSKISLTEEYEFVEIWPKLELQWHFTHPEYLAIDANDNVYIADVTMTSSAIYKYDSDGKYLNILMHGDCTGIAVGDSGNIYVECGAVEETFLKFDSKGKLLSSNKMKSPLEYEGKIAFTADSKGNKYTIIMHQMNGSIYIRKYSSDNRPLAKWRKNGTDKGSIGICNNISIDKEGNIWIADTYNNKIQKFSHEGEFILAFGKKGDQNGQFKRPSAVAFDHSGNLYVADTGNERIQKFNSKGDFISKWPGRLEGEEKCELKYIATDSKENVYVSDAAECCIKKFDSSGRFITK